MKDSDEVTYAPFVVWSQASPTRTDAGLYLHDSSMVRRTHIFEERDGWCGNGYDWESIARIVIEERLPEIKGRIRFDPEAGMFVALGPLELCRLLGAEMKQVFEDDDRLRDLLTRAELD